MPMPLSDETKIAMIEAQTDQLIAHFRQGLGEAFMDGNGEALNDTIQATVDRFDPRLNDDPVCRLMGRLMMIGWNTVITRLAGEGCIPPSA